MDDLTLWRSLKSGNKTAFETIYSDHIRFLLNYGRKFSRNELLVEDCVQDLFIEIWNNRDRLSDTDSIKKYLLVSLRRKIIRQLGRSQKEQGELTGNERFDVELAIDAIMIRQEMDNEQSQKLKKAFEQLSDRQKEVVYLKYYGEMDYDKICEIMDLQYQSARNLLSGALKKLKSILNTAVSVLSAFFLWL